VAFWSSERRAARRGARYADTSDPARHAGTDYEGESYLSRFGPRVGRNEHDVDYVLRQGVTVLRQFRARALFVFDPLLTADVGQLLRDYDVALALIFGR
jgi:hypothetical protein